MPYFTISIRKQVSALVEPFQNGPVSNVVHHESKSMTKGTWWKAQDSDGRATGGRQATTKHSTRMTHSWSPRPRSRATWDACRGGGCGKTFSRTRGTCMCAPVHLCTNRAWPNLRDVSADGGWMQGGISDLLPRLNLSCMKQSDY